MNLEVEQLFVARLREWLLLKLPGRVTAINALRPAVLRAPLAGPYTIPVGAKLHYSGSEAEGTFTDIPFTDGTRTAAELAADVESVVPGLAAADSMSRFALTALVAPTPGTDSFIALGEDSTGAMAALGFDAGGERLRVAALEAPGVKEVMDGMPMMPDSNAGRFWVVLGDTASVPVEPGPRRDEYTVSVNLGLCVPVPMGNEHRNREHIRAALRAVRECLFIETMGRNLGAAGLASGIQLVFERQCVIRSRPTMFDELPHQLFGRANLELQARIYEKQGD